MNTMADQISELSEEEQEQFHRYVQRSLKRQRAKVHNQTEREQDEIDRRKQCNFQTY